MQYKPCLLQYKPSSVTVSYLQMYVARHDVTMDKVQTATRHQETIYKLVDEQGTLHMKLHEVHSLGEGVLPNDALQSDGVLVRQRFLPTAASVLDMENQAKANMFLTGRFWG